jgi:NADH:ubiquinone oxidoreductase subunit E
LTDEQKVQSIINKHHGLRKNLIALLLDIQTEFSYLPAESLRRVAKALDMALCDIIGVVTFYRAFSLKPRGKHFIQICLGTACHVRGGARILEEFEQRLDVQAGDTTKDKQFTVETVACLGCCAIGPVVTVDGTYFGHTTVRKVDTILKKYQKSVKAAPKAQASPAH